MNTEQRLVTILTTQPTTSVAYQRSWYELRSKYDPVVDYVCFKTLHFTNKGKDIKEDAKVRTWVRIFKGLPNFKGGCSFKTWVYTIARNVSNTINLNIHKADTEVELVSTSDDNVLKNTPDTGAIGEEHVQNAESDEIRVPVLCEALLLMDTERRNLLMRYVMTQASYHAVGVTASPPVKEGTVKSGLYRSRQKLQVHLDLNL